MKTNTKAKWSVGVTGAAFSAFILGQLNNPEPQNSNHSDVKITANMSTQEKKLAKLDWSSFSTANNYEGNYQNDRNSRRS